MLIFDDAARDDATEDQVLPRRRQRRLHADMLVGRCFATITTFYATVASSMR